MAAETAAASMGKEIVSIHETLKNNSIIHVSLVVISIVQVMQEVECTCKGRLDKGVVQILSSNCF